MNNKEMENVLMILKGTISPNLQLMIRGYNNLIEILVVKDITKYEPGISIKVNNNDNFEIIKTRFKEKDISDNLILNLIKVLYSLIQNNKEICKINYYSNKNVIHIDSRYVA
jgi:hypothetical protein